MFQSPYQIREVESDRLSIIVDPDDDPINIRTEEWTAAVSESGSSEPYLELYFHDESVLPSGDPRPWMFVVSGSPITESDVDTHGSTVTGSPWQIDDDCTNGVEILCNLWTE